MLYSSRIRIGNRFGSLFDGYVSRFPRWPTEEERSSMRLVNATRQNLRDGIVREFRRLGARPTEISHLMRIQRATLTRILASGEREPAIIRSRHLTSAQRDGIVLFWCRKIASANALAPSTLDRLLVMFCDSCRKLVISGKAPEANDPGAGNGQPSVEDDEPSAESKSRHDKETFLASAYAGGIDLKILHETARVLCRETKNPKQCFTGASRFAILCEVLRANPWRVAEFLIENVSDRRVWARTCIECGGTFVSESPAHRHCDRCPSPAVAGSLSLAASPQPQLAVRA